MEEASFAVPVKSARDHDAPSDYRGGRGGRGGEEPRVFGLDLTAALVE